ncbi:MAG: FapA family protein [Spirochaetota bacterium]
MAQAVAKGNLTLTVEQDELEARFDFVPDQAGAEWTTEKVFKLAMDARIAAVTQKRAEEIVGKFSRARGSVTEVLAKGLAPEKPVSEQAEWAELPVPEDLHRIVEGLLSAAEAPVLHRTKTQTIKTEKKMTKPGALPFLPSRVETVVISEKVESRERVYTDADVTKSGFVRKGERVAVLSPAKPGKIGKSIFGKPIGFSGDAGTFIIGNGILRNKNELLADEDGVVRGGATWVEIIPLASHRYKVERSPNGTTLLLDYWPGHPRLPPPSSGSVIADAVKLGVPTDDLLDAAAIDAAISGAATSGDPLVSFPLSPDRDALVKVDISPDGLVATLTILKGRGRGKALDLAAVSAALKASGLKGLPMEEVKKTVIAFFKGGEQELRDYVLIEGKVPTRGKDRSLALALSPLPKDRASELRTRLAQHPELESAIPSLAEFPLGSSTSLAYVTEGQRIGELSTPVPGQSGVDIRGNTLPGIPGNDPVIHCHEGVVFAKGTLTANRAGLLMSEEKEGVWHFRVAAFRDASIEVHVSSDGMEGLLSLRAEDGLGRGLEVESVIKAMGDRGIVFGIDPRAIAEAVADARAGKPVLRRVVARGRPALPSGGNRMEWLVGADPGKRPSDAVKVAVGKEILRVSQGAAGGVEGSDVLGKPLPPLMEGAGADVPEHDPTIVEKTREDGSLVFCAAVAGELLATESRLSIREKLALTRDLTAAEGELRFAGAVEIGGSILAGARLFAGGDVTINGSVDASVVSSEGNVAVGGGVKGAKRGTIRAMRGLELSYAEQVLLLAVEDILIRGACMLCNVKTNGKLSLGGVKGVLVGGLIRARHGIDVEVLGSDKGTKTEVAFGQDYLVADMIENEEKEIGKIKTAILQSDRVMAELQRAGAGLEQIRLDKVKLLKLLEKRSVRLFDFREKFEQHFPAEVRVRGTVFPGVILESHNRFFEVRSKKVGVIFSFDPSNGRITERSLK